MDKCSPVVMRKNLEVVDQFKKWGIDFVPIPVRSQAHKNMLIEMGDQIFDELADKAEGGK